MIDDVINEFLIYILSFIAFALENILEQTNADDIHIRIFFNSELERIFYWSKWDVVVVRI